MFSWISDSEQHHNDYELARMKRIKQNNAMAVKLGIKGLKSSLDAMQCKRSPPTDSCSEYDPNSDSELEGDLSQCSSLGVRGRCPVLFTHQGTCSNFPRLHCSHISCNWCFALLLLCWTAISLVYTSCMWIRPAYPFSVHIPSVIIPYLSIQMLFLCIRRSKGRGRLLIVEEHKQSIWKR